MRSFIKPIEISPDTRELCHSVNRDLFFLLRFISAINVRNNSHKCNVSQYRQLMLWLNVYGSLIVHLNHSHLCDMKIVLHFALRLAVGLAHKKLRLLKNNFLKSWTMLCLSKLLFSICATKLRLFAEFCRYKSCFSFAVFGLARSCEMDFLPRVTANPRQGKCFIVRDELFKDLSSFCCHLLRA